MIRSFRSKGLRLLWEDNNPRRLAVPNVNRVRRILAALNEAKVPGDMNLPGWRFHPLGEMAPGRYAVEASGNYRVTFAFADGDAVEVDLEDYH